ncbi:hypothetical protein BDV96DRAFT_651627 [Lophiotrema nucula]|uniref:Uncharacterized protein n=1 Tax=Lophiotrema nucula TaxID=690887 RepID=A0A6A5YU75_9PLEO|nr:hypothetical protein BDV96DRAFT_651627 [Lophiotrema nucula]
MPDYATSTGDSGNRDRRPPKLVAGEVTRKSSTQNNEDESFDPPPRFNGRRRRAGKWFLDQDPLVANNIQEDSNADPTLQELPGLRLESTSSQSTTTVSTHDEANPLAAPVGWRRFLGFLHEDYLDDPDIILGPLCKACFDNGNVQDCGLELRGLTGLGFTRLGDTK